MQPSELTLGPNMVIRPNVLRSVKASQSHLDPVVEDSFVHCKGAAASVTKAALGLGRGSIARWLALGPRECTDEKMNVGEECRARQSATHPTVTINGADMPQPGEIGRRVEGVQPDRFFQRLDRLTRPSSTPQASAWRGRRERAEMGLQRDGPGGLARVLPRQGGSRKRAWGTQQGRHRA